MGTTTIFFVFELKKQLSDVLDTLADTKSRQVADMNGDVCDMSPTRHSMLPFGQQNRHFDIQHNGQEE
jgi:hypothetical protein